MQRHYILASTVTRRSYIHKKPYMYLIWVYQFAVTVDDDGGCQKAFLYNSDHCLPAVIYIYILYIHTYINMCVSGFTDKVTQLESESLGHLVSSLAQLLQNPLACLETYSSFNQ